jgi:hypothetical protein
MSGWLDGMTGEYPGLQPRAALRPNPEKRSVREN